MNYEVKISLIKKGIDTIKSITKKTNKIKINFLSKLNFNIKLVQINNNLFIKLNGIN